MKCSYFKNNKCRSCNLLSITYADTILLKETDLKQYFPQHQSHIKPTYHLISDAEGSRNKAKFAVFLQKNEMTFGFYNSDGSTRELEKCPLHADGINDLLSHIKDVIKHQDINNIER